ncbi:hypothetical protein BDR04DRAFT_1109437 [Suillus decipiens]|nr:hypothetical protein BDR04DRAFT_1109437 [Suillus decipiens]
MLAILVLVLAPKSLCPLQSSQSGAVTLMHNANGDADASLVPTLLLCETRERDSACVVYSIGKFRLIGSPRLNMYEISENTGGS